MNHLMFFLSDSVFQIATQKTSGVNKLQDGTRHLILEGWLNRWKRYHKTF